MSTATREATREHNRQQEFAALHERTRALHLYEFWSVGGRNEHQAVADLQRFTKAVPHIWKYRDILPCLFQAAELIRWRIPSAGRSCW